MVDRECLPGRWAGLYIYPHGETDGESDFTIYMSDPDEDDTVKMHGEGSDRVGPFHFKGHIGANAKVKFDKHYSTHMWQYSGTLDADSQTIYGRWGVQQPGGGGYFAFHRADGDVPYISAEDIIEYIKGDWSGTAHNVVEDKDHEVNFVLKASPDRKDDQLVIHGHGKSDRGHSYKINGMVSSARQVIFAKIYTSHNTFVYRGTLSEDGTTMAGHYSGKNGHGTFEYNRQ